MNSINNTKLNARLAELNRAYRRLRLLSLFTTIALGVLYANFIVLLVKSAERRVLITFIEMTFGFTVGLSIVSKLYSVKVERRLLSEFVETESISG